MIIKPALILASNSPARQQLLRDANIPFIVETLDFDEEQAKQMLNGLTIIEQAQTLAHGKGVVVSEQHPDHLVLSADQIGELHGCPLFKPLNRENNISMLLSMSGQTHQQHTAACLFYQGSVLQTFQETVSLTMQSLDIEAIKTYVDQEQAYQCCGGFRYESLGKALFNHIDGSTESIIGLPLQDIVNFMHTSGYTQPV